MLNSDGDSLEGAGCPGVPMPVDEEEEVACVGAVGLRRPVVPLSSPERGPLVLWRMSFVIARLACSLTHLPV